MQLVSQRDERTGYLCLQVTSKFIDASNASEMRTSLRTAVEGEAKCVLDLAKVDFIDSSGLGVLLSCLRLANDKGQKLALANLTPSVQALFELVRMHRSFKIYSSRDEAIAALEAE